MVGRLAEMAAVAQKPSQLDCGFCASCGSQQNIKVMLSHALLLAKGWFNNLIL
jgi:hypothetical protein